MKFYQIAKLVKFNFTEVSQFMWNSFGPDIKIFDFECASIIQEHTLFGTIYVNPKGSVIYGIFSVKHIDLETSHMWIHPDFYQDFLKEHEEKGVSFNDEKANIIYSEKEFISKIKEHTESPECNITVEIEDNIILHITKEAHEQDITFNDMVNQIIESNMKELLTQTPI